MCDGSDGLAGGNPGDADGAAAVKRADVALVERGLFPSRAKAREAIEAGLVRVDGKVLSKPSVPVAGTAKVEARQPYPWVSRGGVKLAAALEHFGLDPAGLTCIDVGASTGGFTHVLLERGAAHVYAVDVGRGQLHPHVAGDARVTELSGTDARDLDATRIATPPDLAVFDLSFISLRLVMETVADLLTNKAMLVALVKPQFEAGRERVGKGVVRDPAVHEAVCRDIIMFLEERGWDVAGIMPSPIEGGDGNREFLLAARRGPGA